MTTAVAVRERPILFSAAMVNAILDGRKTQTRRVVKPQPVSNGTWNRARSDFDCLNDFYPPSATLWKGAWLGGDAGELEACPHGVVGDRLWVRETHWFDVRDAGGLVIYADGRTHRYRIDGIEKPCELGITPEYLAQHEFWRQRPSIFMPRWASRITLEITNVRVERLQSISETDAIAEVCDISAPRGAADASEWLSPCEQYRNLWDSLNAKRGYPWESNPWVFVIEFAQVTA